MGEHAVRAPCISPDSALWFLIFITNLAKRNLESLLLHRTQSHDLEFMYFTAGIMYCSGLVSGSRVCVCIGGTLVVFLKVTNSFSFCDLETRVRMLEASRDVAPKPRVRACAHTRQCSPALPAPDTLCLMRFD